MAAAAAGAAQQQQQRVAPALNVGIRGIALYFPRLYVSQADLEQADGCINKYTQGLGQEAMAFCGDREDVVSMAATAVLRLLEESRVSPADIGRIDVGTETGVDRSKSVMSFLLAHFEGAGNTSVQGSDHMHGCYGGTAALLSVADWVAGPGWDGRLGLAVATDIAVYPDASPARPTGGGGAVALLVGPDAPLVLEPWPWRSTFSCHAFDFFKPHGHPLYPVLDGPATTMLFTKAADACASRLYRQLAAQQQVQQQQQAPGLLGAVDYFLSHAPYSKIVRKVFARIALQDALRAHQQQQQPDAAAAAAAPSSSSGCSVRPGLPPLPPEASGLNPDALPDSSISDKQLEAAALAASEPMYQAMASQGASLQRQLGNLYTASLYSGLAALLHQQGAALAGKRLLCFSFGSGVVAAMFVLRGRCPHQQPLLPLQGAPCSLQAMADQLQLQRALDARLRRSPAQFGAAMDSLRAAYGAAPCSPSYGPVEELAPGTVYLAHVDEAFRRCYARMDRGGGDSGDVGS